MRSPTANWTAQNTANQELVIYVNPGGTRRFLSLSRLDNIGGVSLTSNELKYLKDFNLKIPKIDFLKGVQTFGAIDFKVLDIQNDSFAFPIVTNDIFSASYFQNTVQSYFGFASLVFADYFQFPDYVMTGNPVLDSSEAIWSFVAEDVNRLLGKKKIFRKPPFDELDGDLTKAAPTGGVEIDVDDATVFIDPSNLPGQWLVDSEITSSNKVCYVSIGQEVCSYEVIDTAATPDELEMNATPAGVDRARFFTERSLHNDGEFVTQFYGFNNMTPCDALLYILLTDGGHTYYDLATFDSGFTDMGFGLTASEVDISSIERIGYKYFPLRQMNCMSLGSHESQDGLKWITDNILKPAGLYLFINSSGLIDVSTINRFEVIDDVTSVKTFVKNDIVRGKINSLTILYEQMINSITLQYNVNPMTRQHTQEAIISYTDSVTQYGVQEDDFVIKSSLINTCDPRLPGVCSGDNPLDREGAMIQWYLYANPPGEIDFDVEPTEWLAEPADPVQLTHDLQNGNRGVSALPMIITEQSISPFRSRFNYKAFIPDLEEQLAIVTSFTANVILQGALDDTTLTFSATNSEVTEAADAFVDVNLQNQAVFVVTIRVTEPSGSAGLFGYFRLGFHIIDDPTGTPADTLAWDTGAIRYATDGNQTYDLKFYLHHGAQIATGLGDRFKIDYFDRNRTGGDEATIAFQEFTFDAGESIAEA